jgi:hypothetical protein
VELVPPCLQRSTRLQDCTFHSTLFPWGVAAGDCKPGTNVHELPWIVFQRLSLEPPTPQRLLPFHHRVLSCSARKSRGGCYGLAIGDLSIPVTRLNVASQRFSIVRLRSLSDEYRIHAWEQYRLQVMSVGIDSEIVTGYPMVHRGVVLARRRTRPIDRVSINRVTWS